MTIHEIRKVDPALARVVIWIEHATVPSIPILLLENLNITLYPEIERYIRGVQL
ncbi:MAG: hypothetical protein QXL96_04745 [Ignisphaera sp.]